jgi:hypothetical protein
MRMQLPQSYQGLCRFLFDLSSAKVFDRFMKSFRRLPDSCVGELSISCIVGHKKRPAKSSARPLTFFCVARFRYGSWFMRFHCHKIKQKRRFCKINFVVCAQLGQPVPISNAG